MVTEIVEMTCRSSHYQSQGMGLKGDDGVSLNRNGSSVVVSSVSPFSGTLWILVLLCSSIFASVGMSAPSP